MSWLGDYLNNKKNKQEIKQYLIKEYNDNKLEIDNFINNKIKKSNAFIYIYLENKILKEIIKKEFNDKYSDLFSSLARGEIKKLSEIEKLFNNMEGETNEELRKN